MLTNTARRHDDVVDSADDFGVRGQANMHWKNACPSVSQYSSGEGR
jgi:hypothetical protein